MSTDHDFLQDPSSAPSRFGRGGTALREAVHKLVSPWFEQARLRTEEVRAETEELRGEIAGLRAELRGELGTVRDECATLRAETAGLRARLDELGGSLAALRDTVQ
ncbi:hypothetical protein, partial [Rathayibacter tanaceti]